MPPPSSRIIHIIIVIIIRCTKIEGEHARAYVITYLRVHTNFNKNALCVNITRYADRVGWWVGVPVSVLSPVVEPRNGAGQNGPRPLFVGRQKVPVEQ